MSWILLAWQRAGEFSGRSRRKEFWFFHLFSIALLLIAGLYSIVFDPAVWQGLPKGNIFSVLVSFFGLYEILAIVPSLSVTIRRLHDAGFSGWWYLISFVPIIGGFILIALLLLDSEAYANRWGRDPKARERTIVPPYAMHH